MVKLDEEPAIRMILGSVMDLVEDEEGDVSNVEQAVSQQVEEDLGSHDKSFVGAEAVGPFGGGPVINALFTVVGADADVLW